MHLLKINSIIKINSSSNKMAGHDAKKTDHGTLIQSI